MKLNDGETVEPCEPEKGGRRDKYTRESGEWGNNFFPGLGVEEGLGKQCKILLDKANGCYYIIVHTSRKEFRIKIKNRVNRELVL